MEKLKGFLLCLVLTACAGAIGIDAGCSAYANARITMPRPLGTGPLDQWVAVLDATMTGVCR